METCEREWSDSSSHRRHLEARRNASLARSETLFFGRTHLIEVFCVLRVQEGNHIYTNAMSQLGREGYGWNCTATIYDTPNQIMTPCSVPMYCALKLRPAKPLASTATDSPGKRSIYSSDEREDQRESSSFVSCRRIVRNYLRSPLLRLLAPSLLGSKPTPLTVVPPLGPVSRPRAGYRVVGLGNQGNGTVEANRSAMRVPLHRTMLA